MRRQSNCFPRHMPPDASLPVAASGCPKLYLMGDVLLVRLHLAFGFHHQVQVLGGVQIPDDLVAGVAVGDLGADLVELADR